MEECKPIRVPFDPKMKLQRNANENDESKGFPYLLQGWVLDVCHVVHTTGLGIPNKCVESTHGQP